MKAVTLFLPTLFHPSFRMEEKAYGQFAPGKQEALSLLLSRAEGFKNKLHGMQDCLHSFFKGLEKGPLPFGALGAFAKGIINASDPGYWCYVSPIECHTDYQSAYIQGSGHLALEPGEIEALQKSLNTLFEADGLKLITVNAQDWFCYVPTRYLAVMQDLSQVLHKNMAGKFPSGPNANYWARLITECQMLLANHLINQTRIKRNKPLISSVWFWGLGKLPASVSTSFDEIYTNDSVLHGLALLAEVPSNPCLEGAIMPFSKGHTLLCDRLFVEAGSSPSEALEYYENKWFVPLLKALKKGDIDRLNICTDQGYEYGITKRRLYYFWRKIRTFDEIIIRMDHDKNRPTS